MQTERSNVFSYALFVFLVILTGFVVTATGIILTSPLSALLGVSVVMVGLLLCRGFWKGEDGAWAS